MSFDIVKRFDDTRDMILKKILIHRSYAAVFGTSEGKLVLEHILKEGYVHNTTFVAGDPQQTMLNEGSRRLALSILRMARMSNEQKIQLLQKHLDEL
jgi:ribosome maturation protein Sdo1